MAHARPLDGGGPWLYILQKTGERQRAGGLPNTSENCRRQGEGTSLFYRHTQRPAQIRRPADTMRE